jgi:hypothetical protein
MNLLVLLFFLQNIIVTAILGYKFFSQKNSAFKNFGIALFLNTIAFAIWSFAIIQQATNLNNYVTAGAAAFITSLIFLLLEGTQEMKAGMRMSIVTIGIIIGVVLFYARTFMYPSAPSISPEGLFFFNLQPVVQMLYIFGLGLAAFPAIEAVASKFKGSYASLVRYSFIIQVMGGVVLMTSSNTQMLYILGWIMGSVYFVLCVTLLFSKKAWSLSN